MPRPPWRACPGSPRTSGRGWCEVSETARRWLTAIGLVPVVVVIVLLLPPAAFHAALLLVVAAGAWEWSRLAGLSPVPVHVALAVASLAVVLVPGAVPGGALAWVGAAWWLAALAAIVRFRGPDPSRAPGRPALALAGWLVLVPAGAALAGVHAGPNGPALAMTLLAVVWAADTGAWFTGRRFGRTRLAPHVSPGKTWEGVAGGVLAGTGIGVGAAWWLGLAWSDLLPAAVLASGASVVGDLYVSVAKRRAGVKDSGRLLPGHGGVLDRIDGLTAAAPVYAVMMAS